MQPCLTVQSTSAITTYSKKVETHTESKLRPDQLSLDHQYERVAHRNVRNSELSIPEDNVPGGYLPHRFH